MGGWEDLLIIGLLLFQSFSNLIIDGDFQNIRPLEQSFFQQGYWLHYDLCQSPCNSWYSSNSGTIDLIQQVIKPLNIITTVADLQNIQPFQTCQQISSMEVGKIYKFGFDLVCHKNHTSCAAWIIWNNQIVNGSNLTNTDKLSHTHIGYVKSIQQNNTICYEGTQTPFILKHGGRLDNATLQLFTQTVPCNVFYCQSCVLNFPDSCLICSNNSVKKSDQTCVLCSILINKCIQCQNLNSVNYICNQCAENYVLTNDRKICHTKTAKSFKSEIAQQYSLENSFLIKTNLSKAQLIFAGINENGYPLIQIRINNQIHKSFVISFTDQQFLMIKVTLLHSYEQLTVQLLITEDFPLINNTKYQFSTVLSGTPSTVFLSQSQLAILSKAKQIISPLLNGLSDSFRVLKNSGLGFFVAGIFNYMNLMTFYAFLNVYSPKNFKIFIDTLIQQMSFFGFFQMFSISDEVYGAVKYTVSQKLIASETVWIGPQQAGFSTNFCQNNLEPITVFVATIVRLGLVWVMHKLLKFDLLASSASLRFNAASTQFHTIIPILLLPAFNLVAQQLASKNYAQKINATLHLTVIFVCIIAPFFQLINQKQQAFRNAEQKRKKLLQQIKIYNEKMGQLNYEFGIIGQQNKNKAIFNMFNWRRVQIIKQLKNGYSTAKCYFYQRIFLITVPIFVLFENIVPFLVVNLCVLIVNFIIILRLHKYLTKSQFFLKVSINLIWMIYHSTFCLFYIVQSYFLQADSANYWQQFCQYLGFVTIALVLIGALMQIFVCLIVLGKIIKEFLTYLYNKRKKQSKVGVQKTKETQQCENNRKILHDAFNIKSKSRKCQNKENKEKMLEIKTRIEKPEKISRQQFQVQRQKIKKTKDEVPLWQLKVTFRQQN